MRANEFLKEAEAAVQKKLGRAFNHLEDLVFFHGSRGTIEALDHIREIATIEGAQSVRMKWDGNPQIYWGREKAFGPLILAGHNGWSKGYKTDNPKDLIDFIANKSGSPKTPEEQAARNEFAKQFASLYPLFDKATPKDFVGFVYADGLFLQRPEVDAEGVYNFCPNPKSQTCYHVTADSQLGKRISQAQVMVVGHAFFPEFGMDDSDQHAIEIDSFLQGAPGLGDLKNILYTYVNQTAKAKALDQLGVPQFFNWLKTSKVSTNKQAKIQELAQKSQHALSAIFGLVKQIMDLKDTVIDQIESGAKGEIWDTQGEGRVRYAPQGKEFGNVKLVPRKRWTPQ